MKNEFYGDVLSISSRLFTASLYMHAKVKASVAHRGGGWGLWARRVKE